MRPLAIVAILAITLLVEQAAAQVAGMPPIRWRSYMEGHHSKITQLTTRVINNEIEWNRYWTEASTKGGRAPTDIKWGNEFLIAVHLGTRPTLGYSVMIESIERISPHDIKVTYVEKTPASDMTGAAQSSPYEIVRVDRASGRFVFEKKTRIDTDGPVPVGIRWKTYETDTDCLIREDLTLVLKSQQELNSYWRRLTGDKAPTDVNWETEILLVIHIGERRSSGYNVYVSSVEPLLDGSVGVFYIEQTPAAGQRVRREPSSPYTIIRIPRTDSPVKFKGRKWDSSG